MDCPTCRRPVAEGTMKCAGCGATLPSAAPPPPPPMGCGAWLATRTLPFVALAVLAGLLTGFLRSRMGFFVGLQGMAAGGILGYVTGRIGRNDPPDHWGCGLRLWRTIWIAALFNVVQLAVTSFAFAGPGEGPFEWLTSVLDGTAGESFYGYRSYRKDLAGTVREGGWAFFNLVDFGLFAFIHIAFTSLGYFPSKTPREEEAEEAEKE